MPVKYVIIGNSIAGCAAVEGIRSIDSEGGITVVGCETHHVYSRPLISYYLRGKVTAERMKYRADDFYDKNNVTLITGRTAEKIDPEGKTVSLDDETLLPYDKVLVATGSVPFTPPMQGIETVTDRFTFMSFDDALALESAVGHGKNKRVLIIGGGLIGLKCAEGLVGRCAEIIVVDLAPRILSSVLDDTGAAIVQKHLEQRGISFILGSSVAKFEGNTAYINDAHFSFDVLVTAVGVKPNTKLVADIGGMCERGIVVDGSMRTTVPFVYAAGDCVCSNDLSCNKRRVLALLPNAGMGGFAAGVNMAGGERRFDETMPMNAVGFFGLNIVTAGSYEGEDTVISKEGDYRRFFVKDGCLVGFILVGRIDKAGIYTALIRNKTPLSEVDFDLLVNSPGLIAFSKTSRRQMLSEVR